METKLENVYTETSICRTCLSTDTDEGISVFDNLFGASITQHLLNIAQVTILKEDRLPERICSKCITDLESTVTFVTRCQNSDSELRTDYDYKLDISEHESFQEINKEELDDHIYHEETNYFETRSDLPITLKSCKSKKIKKEKLNEDNYYLEETNYLKTPSELPLTLKSCKPKKLKKTVCEHCNRNFRNKRLLAHHTRTEHAPYTCKYCSKPYKIKENYINHEQNCSAKNVLVNDPNYEPGTNPTNDDLIKCSKCGKMLNRSSFKSHLKRMHSNTTLICEHCKKIYKERARFEKHIINCKVLKYNWPVTFRGIGKDRKCMCNVCGLVTTYHKFTKHISTHAIQRQFQCTKCPKNYKTNDQLKRHMLAIHTSSELVPCDKCGKLYAPFHLKAHLIAVHGEKKYNCDSCDKSFTLKTVLSNHMLRHKPKSVHCDNCPKKFYTNTELKEHILNSHSTTKYFYKCPYGEASFRCKGTLHCHKQNAVPESHFCCQAPCNKIFSSKVDLEHHKQSHEGSCPCTFCFRLLSNKATLWIHIRKRHKDKIKQFNLHEKFNIKKLRTRDHGSHKCPYCDDLFASPFSARRHIENKHPGEEKKVINVNSK